MSRAKASIIFYLLPEDKIRLQEEATKEDLSLSDYCQKLLVGKVAPRRTTDASIEIETAKYRPLPNIPKGGTCQNSKMDWTNPQQYANCAQACLSCPALKECSEYRNECIRNQIPVDGVVAGFVPKLRRAHADT